MVEVADLAEVRERGDVEVDGAASLVGIARVKDDADQGQDFGDGRRCPRLRPRRDEPERLHVAVEAGDLFGGQIKVVDAEFASFAQEVVVDVGDIANAPRLVTEVTQPALQDVEGEVHLGMSEVRRVIRSDPA